ncbi:ATP-binding cassette domain-containing protein, partial [Haploplasma axanthum]|uniref:ABC transporter ATP-binding protein/permease n=1 Tax=Haploplasma axanthum TaxID=29552 RepID=UPI00047E41CB
TLLNLIGALDKYDSGSIKVDNKELKEMSSRELDDYRANEIGIIFQEYNLLENFSVKENINMPLLIQGIENENPIDEALRNVELEEMKNRKTNELSGGQRQRVAIARTIVKKPRIILADEPTGAVDSETAEIIFKCLKKLSETSLVIIASHDLESANKYADRIISFKDGRIVEDRVINDKNQSIVKKEEETAKLKNKEILKLALSFLFRKPKRLIMILLIFILSLTGIIISDTLSTDNTDRVLLTEINKNEVNYLKYSKQIETNSEIEAKFRYMSNEDFEIFSSKIKTGSIQVMYNYYQSTIMLKEDKVYFSVGNNGIIEYNDDLISKYNFNIEGQKPKKNNEIMISKFYFEMYKKFGYNTYENGELKSVRINSLDDFKDISLKLGFKDTYHEFKIVGILDTKIDEKVYSLVDKAYDMDNTNSLYAFKSLYLEGFHDVFYVNDGYYNDVIAQNKNTLYESKIEIRVNDEKIFGIDKISLLSSDMDTIHWKDGHDFDNFKDKEIILSSKALKSISLFEDIYDVIKIRKKKLIMDFAFEHFDEVEEKINDIYGNTDYEWYANYIENYNYYENEFHPFKTSSYFENEAFRMYCDEVVFPNIGKIEMKTSNGDSIYEANVVGASYSNDIVYHSKDSNFPIVFKELFNDQAYFYVNLSKELNNMELIKIKNHIYKDDKENEYRYAIMNNEFVEFEKIKNDFNIFIIVGTILSLVLIFIGVLIYFFNQINNIKERENEIGILRSLGVSRNIVFKVFLYEAILIMSFITIISFMLSTIGVEYLNGFIAGKLQTSYNLLYITSKQGFIMLFFILTIILSCIYIPFKRISKNEIVTLIKKVE